MNYGYTADNFLIKLNQEDEINRYSAQLYHLLATSVNIEGKNLLEVGCGRGGGLSYINRYLKPKSATGIDLSAKAIKFCQKNYARENINFLQGNAESLTFDDNSFDVIINIESSHRYADMDSFLQEVDRVLKPNGFFLFTDFRQKENLEKLHTSLDKSNLIPLKNDIITKNILEALKLASNQRKELINALAPKIFHRLANNFAATEGSPTYNSFKNNDLIYFYYIFQKKTN